MTTHTAFRPLAHHLCDYHPPKDEATAGLLGTIRAAFHNLINDVAPVIPPGPDATIAARSIHRACQDVIAAVILNPHPDDG